MKIINQNGKPCGKLEWLPTWEGVLMYDPEDLKNDRPVRIWHVITRKSKCHGVQRIAYELKPYLDSCCYKKNVCNSLRPRCAYQFNHKGKKFRIYRYHATMLAYFAFVPENTKLYVADHYDKNTLNDRISNLRYIPQRENLSRSESLKESQRLSNAERRRRARIRMAWKEQMRPHVIATIGPGATAIDVEFELTQLLNEHKFDYGLTPVPGLTPRSAQRDARHFENPSPKGEGNFKGEGSRNS